MIYLIGGDNYFQSRTFVGQLSEGYKKSGLTLKTAYINDEINYDLLLSSMDSVGLFGENCFYLIKGFEEANKLKQEQLEQILKHKNEEIIIWSRGPLDKRTRIYKLVQQKGKIESFENPKGLEITKWIKRYDVENNLGLDTWMISELVNRFSNNFSVLFNEIEKLRSLRDEGIKIDRRIFDIIISSTVDTNVWELVDTLGSINNLRGLEKLDSLLKVFDYEYLVALILRQIRLLYLGASFKNKQDLVAAGVHPYVAEKVLRQSNNLTLEKLKKLYQKLVDMEIAVKTGKIDKSLALDLLIIAI